MLKSEKFNVFEYSKERRWLFYFIVTLCGGIVWTVLLLWYFNFKKRREDI